MSYNASVRVYYVKSRFKQWVFMSWQKDVVFVEAWMDAGRLFHTAGPAWLNARSTKTVFNLGILYTSLLVTKHKITLPHSVVIYYTQITALHRYTWQTQANMLRITDIFQARRHGARVHPWTWTGLPG